MFIREEVKETSALEVKLIHIGAENARRRDLRRKRGERRERKSDWGAVVDSGEVRDRVRHSLKKGSK